MSKKKYLSIQSGFYRFRSGFEINWCFTNWALPISIDFGSRYLVFIQILFLTFIIPKK